MTYRIDPERRIAHTAANSSPYASREAEFKRCWISSIGIPAAAATAAVVAVAATEEKERKEEEEIEMDDDEE